MSFTESAYTPERSITDRTPEVADGAPGAGEALTRTTVLRDVSAVKYRLERAVTI